MAFNLDDEEFLSLDEDSRIWVLQRLDQIVKERNARIATRDAQESRWEVNAVEQADRFAAIRYSNELREKRRRWKDECLWPAILNTEETTLHGLRRGDDDDG